MSHMGADYKYFKVGICTFIILSVPVHNNYEQLVQYIYLKLH